MTERNEPELTKPELAVMKSLWKAGRQSAREVHETAGEANDWAYSTTRTIIERMVKKGLLSKNEFHGIYLYDAKISRVQGLASLVKDFAHRVLEIEPAPVVSLFAQGDTLTSEEIDQLAQMLYDGVPAEGSDEEVES